jgi:uncharacterized Fe-S cluster protein YjdI
MHNKTYKGTDFEVLWQPDVCIHSTICWKNLKSVFDPFRRPWIVLENGEREAIKNQVHSCPSGALKWIEKESSETVAESTEAKPDLIHIEQTPNGPLVIKGDFMLVHSDGKREVKEKTTALCRCGASSRKPFCDGSHARTGFEG